VILAYFPAPFICNIIIISWEGEGINEVLEEHGCIKCLVYGEGFALNALFYGGRKLFRGLCAHTWLQESSFGNRGISQTNPSIFSRIHEPPGQTPLPPNHHPAIPAENKQIS
jgi:hypothetical protein